VDDALINGSDAVKGRARLVDAFKHIPTETFNIADRFYFNRTIRVIARDGSYPSNKSFSKIFESSLWDMYQPMSAGLIFAVLDHPYERGLAWFVA
jgi:hypothetical protein